MYIENMFAKTTQQEDRAICLMLAQTTAAQIAMSADERRLYVNLIKRLFVDGNNTMESEINNLVSLTVRAGFHPENTFVKKAKEKHDESELPWARQHKAPKAKRRLALLNEVLRNPVVIDGKEIFVQDFQIVTPEIEAMTSIIRSEPSQKKGGGSSASTKN